MPKISVVMPIYNGEEFLPEAMDSILQQTMGDFEFLIVEEYGNGEACHRLLEEYAARDPRIRIISNSGSRLGIAASLNVGLDHATGEYIARMDGDDVSGPERFRVQAMYLDTYRDVDICGVIPSVMNSPDWILENSSDPEVVRTACLFGVPIKHPTVMMRTQRINDLGLRYDPALKGVEDFDFFFRASLDTKLANIREPSLFEYRRWAENASAVFLDRDISIGRHMLKASYQKYLGTTLTPMQTEVTWAVNNWKKGNSAYQKAALAELQKLFYTLLNNKTVQQTYQREALLESMRRKWRKVYTQIVNTNGGVKKTSSGVHRLYTNSEFFRP